MDVTRQGIEDQRTRYYTRCSLLKESGQVRQVFDLASFLWCTVGSDGTAVGIDQSKTCLRPDLARHVVLPCRIHLDFWLFEGRPKIWRTGTLGLSIGCLSLERE